MVYINKLFREVPVADHGKIFKFGYFLKSTNLIDNGMHVTAETSFIGLNFRVKLGSPCSMA